MDVPQRRSVAATLSESNRTALQRWPAAEQQHSLTDRPCTTFDRSSRAAISSGGPVDQGHHGDRLHERGLGVRRRTGSRAGGMDRTVSLMMTSRSRGNRRRCEVGSRGANIWSATCTSVRVARRASSTRVRRVKRSRVRRRSTSILVSPGPRPPLPPASRDSETSARCASRGSRYLSCASSTWSLRRAWSHVARRCRG